MSRYDVIPEDLVLNNTVQIVYDDLNEPASKVVVAGWPVLDDTDFVPVLKREMAPADIEYELNVWFDVCPSVSFPSSLADVKTYDDGSNRGSFNNVYVTLTSRQNGRRTNRAGHTENPEPHPSSRP